MTDDAPAQPLLDLLSRLSGGEMTLEWNHLPWVHLDVRARDLDISLDPLAESTTHVRSLLHAGRIVGWKNLGIPGRLARIGWRVTLESKRRPLLALGRGTSALTGHVHVELSALPELARRL